MTQLDSRTSQTGPLEDERAAAPWMLEREPPPQPKAAGGEEAEEVSEPAPDVSQARSFLTGLLPAGMGEVLVTDVWAWPQPKPEPKPRRRAEPQEVIAEWQRALEEGLTRARAGGAPATQPAPAPEAPPESQRRPEAGPEPDPGKERQRAWESRQELRELGLLRERPLVSYDARVEAYWGQVRDARGQATKAMVDPYTDLVAAFADADLAAMGEHQRNAREYGWRAESLLELGRAYVAIGKLRGARSVLKAAARADPGHPGVWWNLGAASLFARANQEAVKAFQQAADQSPGDFRSEIGLALAHYHSRDYAAAEEQLRRLSGATGPRAAARSMLGCSLRMQEKWDEARVELGFLRESQGADWPQMAQQCLDCLDRGEQKRAGPLRRRRRAQQMWRSLAAAVGGGLWIAYARAQDLFREQAPWAALPLFLVALMLARGLRGLTGRELPGEFGNAEQGMPCWQATTWMRPRRSEF